MVKHIYASKATNYGLLAFFLIISSILNSIRAQDAKTFEIGIESQAYPAGLINTINTEFGIASHQVLNFRVGHNLLRHRDLGVHEDERGYGFGFTAGYRYYIDPEIRGLYFGVRSDLWFNTVDWQDNIGTPQLESGTTEIIVLQPTLEAGYKFLSANEKFTFTPTLAFGFESNIKSEGADVGQGAILLVGIILNYRAR